MTPPAKKPAASLPRARRLLPLLLLLFVASGCSALIYEIVWFQLLQLVIGSSAISLGVLLGTFMGGMCLGSLILPRVIAAQRRPLRVYALLELGIGGCGLVILFGIPYVDQIYVASVGHGLPGVLLRGLVAQTCLLPPTLLMGATLPAVARSLETTPQEVSWLGFFYGGNIAGAVFGCLLTGFYLLRVYDMATAVYVAAAINVTVALLGLGLADLVPHAAADDSALPRRPARSAGAGLVYVAIALSGLCALSAEVIWTRVLSLMLGATVYTFSIILAVFLVGLGIGSSVGSFLARSAGRPRLLLALCQLLLAGAIAWTGYMATRSLPYWPIEPALSQNLPGSEGIWINFQLDLARCLWAILPATLLWGASFPLALAAVAAPGQDPGRLVGGVYAANTVGAIVGAVGSSLFLMARAGTQHSEQLLIGLSAGAAGLALVASLWPERDRASTLDTTQWLTLMPPRGLLAALIVVPPAVLLARTVPELPGELIAFGRELPKRHGEARILESREGLNSSVAVSEEGTDTRYFHVSGKTEASTLPQDMRLQRMLGHLAALVHSRPRSVLVVGCGAGVTAGTFVLHPDVQRIVICEIEPLVPQVVADYFARENYDVLHDSRVEVVHDDARHYMLTAREKFDVITSDPIHPWVKGSATLYTTEYFELCKRRLNPGGVVTQWVPLYESDEATVKSEFATFFDAFPDGTVWSNSVDNEGYDVVLLGQAEPTRIDVEALEQRLGRADHARVAQSLRDIGFGGTTDLLATYAGRGNDLKPWLLGAEINHDRNLRLQYLAGLALNRNLSKVIYRAIAAHRQFPDDLFVGSDAHRQALKLMLQ